MSELAPVERDIIALQERVRVLEAEVTAVIAAVHLMGVSAKPTSDWLDAKLAGIREQSVVERLAAPDTNGGA